jgi:hypothetical protein
MNPTNKQIRRIYDSTPCSRMICDFSSSLSNELSNSYSFRQGQNVVIPEILKVVLKERHRLAFAKAGHNTKK